MSHIGCIWVCVCVYVSYWMYMSVCLCVCLILDVYECVSVCMSHIGCIWVCVCVYVSYWLYMSVCLCVCLILDVYECVSVCMSHFGRIWAWQERSFECSSGAWRQCHAAQWMNICMTGMILWVPLWMAKWMKIELEDSVLSAMHCLQAPLGGMTLSVSGWIVTGTVTMAR